MARPQTFRFAAGSLEAPFSGVWRLVVNGNDVFLGASKGSMSVFKNSLHQSGVWVLAATQQSGATFERGNRRAKRWSRPLDHVAGVTRGPSVFVPHTSLGSRPLSPDERNPEILWYQAPGDRETVEFSLYFVKPGVATKWNTNETELAQCPAADGSRVFLLASSGESPADFEEACEKMLRENVFRIDDPSEFLGGSLLWITESRDEYKVPVIVELPVPIGPSCVSHK